ncbi:putative uncharacterized protein DDB_G0282133 isoform X2 [Gordionus sp. m RMFG-2023]
MIELGKHKKSEKWYTSKIIKPHNKLKSVSITQYQNVISTKIKSDDQISNKEVCKKWVKFGECMYGDSCVFRHDKIKDNIDRVQKFGSINLQIQHSGQSGESTKSHKGSFSDHLQAPKVDKNKGHQSTSITQTKKIAKESSKCKDSNTNLFPSHDKRESKHQIDAREKKSKSNAASKISSAVSSAKSSVQKKASKIVQDDIKPPQKLLTILQPSSIVVVVNKTLNSPMPKSNVNKIKNNTNNNFNKNKFANRYRRTDRNINQRSLPIPNIPNNSENISHIPSLCSLNIDSPREFGTPYKTAPRYNTDPYDGDRRGGLNYERQHTKRRIYSDFNHNLNNRDTEHIIDREYSQGASNDDSEIRHNNQNLPEWGRGQRRMGHFEFNRRNYAYKSTPNHTARYLISKYRRGAMMNSSINNGNQHNTRYNKGNNRPNPFKKFVNLQKTNNEVKDAPITKSFENRASSSSKRNLKPPPIAIKRESSSGKSTSKNATPIIKIMKEPRTIISRCVLPSKKKMLASALAINNNTNGVNVTNNITNPASLDPNNVLSGTCNSNADLLSNYDIGKILTPTIISPTLKGNIVCMSKTPNIYLAKEAIIRKAALNVQMFGIQQKTTVMDNCMAASDKLISSNKVAIIKKTIEEEENNTCSLEALEIKRQILLLELQREHLDPNERNTNKGDIITNSIITANESSTTVTMPKAPNFISTFQTLPTPVPVKVITNPNDLNTKNADKSSFTKDDNPKNNDTTNLKIPVILETDSGKGIRFFEDFSSLSEDSSFEIDTEKADKKNEDNKKNVTPTQEADVKEENTIKQTKDRIKKRSNNNVQTNTRSIAETFFNNDQTSEEESSVKEIPREDAQTTKTRKRHIRKIKTEIIQNLVEEKIESSHSRSHPDSEMEEGECLSSTSPHSPLPTHESASNDSKSGSTTSDESSSSDDSSSTSKSSDDGSDHDHTSDDSTKSTKSLTIKSTKNPESLKKDTLKIAKNVSKMNKNGAKKGSSKSSSPTRSVNISEGLSPMGIDISNKSKAHSNEGSDSDSKSSATKSTSISLLKTSDNLESPIKIKTQKYSDDSRLKSKSENTAEKNKKSSPETKNIRIGKNSNNDTELKNASPNETENAGPSESDIKIIFDKIDTTNGTIEKNIFNTLPLLENREMMGVDDIMKKDTTINSESRTNDFENISSGSSNDSDMDDDEPNTPPIISLLKQCGVSKYMTRPETYNKIQRLITNNGNEIKNSDVEPTFFKHPYALLHSYYYSNKFTKPLEKDLDPLTYLQNNQTAFSQREDAQFRHLMNLKMSEFD